MIPTGVRPLLLADGKQQHEQGQKQGQREKPLTLREQMELFEQKEEDEGEATNDRREEKGEVGGRGEEYYTADAYRPRPLFNPPPSLKNCRDPMSLELAKLSEERGTEGKGGKEGLQEKRKKKNNNNNGVNDNIFAVQQRGGNQIYKG